MFSVFFADDTTSLAKGLILNNVIKYINWELQKMVSC